MKKILLIFTLLFFAGAATAQEEPASLWDRANTAYMNNEFPQAIAYYDSIFLQGQVSSRLYYNLGNAYFKDGQIGRAILNYERAHNLAPADSDIKHNLKVANGYIKDKIEPVPEFFLTTWFSALRMSLSSDAWAGISILVFIVLLISILFYLLGRRFVLRKAGFYTAVISLLIFIMTVSFSAMERSQMLNSDEAIVLNRSTVVLSSPDASSKELFIIHEGTKVTVVRTLGEWQEVMIADGKKGWVNNRSIETI